MLMYELRPGMLVIHRGKVAKVIKPKQKYALVQHSTGEQWNAPPSRLEPAPVGSTFVLDVPEVTDLVEGCTVRFRRGTQNATSHPGPYVVTKVTPTGFRLAKLGGQGGRYFPSVPGTEIEEMSLTDIKVYLAYLG